MSYKRQPILPDIPATMCSYFRWENTLKFPTIFFGEIVAAETVEFDGVGCTGDAMSAYFLSVDLICVGLLLILFLLLSILETISRILVILYT